MKKNIIVIETAYFKDGEKQVSERFYDSKLIFLQGLKKANFSTAIIKELARHDKTDFVFKKDGIRRTIEIKKPN